MVFVEVLGERADVFGSFSERWEADGEDIEAVVEVFAEASFADLRGEVAVGCGDEAYIGLQGFASAEAFE